MVTLRNDEAIYSFQELTYVTKDRIEIILGVFLGLVMPIGGYFLVLEFRPELKGLRNFSSEVLVKEINVELLTMGIIINAALFFLCLRFDKEQISRGILISSAIGMLGVFIYRFLL